MGKTKIKKIKIISGVFFGVLPIILSSCSAVQGHTLPTNNLLPLSPENNQIGSSNNSNPLGPNFYNPPTNNESPQTDSNLPSNSKPPPPTNTNSSSTHYSYSVSSNNPNFRFTVPQYNPTTGEEFAFLDAANRPKLDNGLDKNGNVRPILNPQPGYSPNKHYDKNFKTSFNLVFENRNKSSGSGTIEAGTGWILDYQKTRDNTYPTVWYIATNVHVINGLYNTKSYAPYNDPESSGLATNNFKMIKWLPPESDYKSYNWQDNWALRSEYQTGEQDKNYSSDRFFAIKSIPKVVYLGIDFHDFNPRQYSKKLYENEVIDFGVIEVEFTNANVAKEITSGYADWAADKQNKFLQTSYLKDPSQIRPYNFYLAGFPGGVPTINRVNMDDANSDLPKYKPTETAAETKQFAPLRERGASLGDWQYLSTFNPNSPKGIGDATLFLPYFYIQYHGKKYTPAGLTYALDKSKLVGGSSGSKVTNSKDEIVSIHAIGYAENDSSVSFALKSEGFAQPVYHSYKTPAYDIIYGGGQGQKTSYYQAMKKLYQNKTGLTTALFSDWNRTV